MAKGFKKNGKFRPTGNKKQPAIHSSDMNTTEKKLSTSHPNHPQYDFMVHHSWINSNNIEKKKLLQKAGISLDKITANNGLMTRQSLNMIRDQLPQKQKTRLNKVLRDKYRNY